jgi:hypothetical protein
MGSLAAGGTQRCNLLPLEVENAATTTPKQPAIVSETLDLAQGFASGQGAPILARGQIVMEKSHEPIEPWKDCDRNHDLRVYGPALLRLV